MNANKPAIVVMAKQPKAGYSKTRLCPPLTPTMATELYKACLEDILESVATIPDIEAYIAVTPPNAIEYFERFNPPFWVLPVDEPSLGQCVDTVTTRLFSSNHTKAIVIPSDCPDLWPEIMTKSLALLEQYDAVFVPSRDGGYNLVGLSRPEHTLFTDGIPWSTPNVLEHTLEVAAQAGLSTALLQEPCTDIDTFEDLSFLHHSLREEPEHRARRTRFVMRRIMGLSPSYSAAQPS